MESGVHVSYRVVEAIADREGVDPADLQPPLFEVVDPDALDALIGQSPSEEVTVEFTYKGYEVVVSKADGVRATPRPDDPDETFGSSGNRLAE